MIDTVMNKHNLKSTDFYMDEIVSIELVGETSTVDITVDDTHMFFANGIYSHNSATQSEVVEADKIADSYAKVMNADFIMSISRKSNDKLNDAARVHIMKNRFGMDGMTFSSKMNTNKGIMEIYDTTVQIGNDKSDKDNNTADRQLLHQKYKNIFGQKTPTAEELNSIG